MENNANKSIEERVDDVLKNRNIMNIRAKLKTIEQHQRRNYLENKKAHFERYRTIVDYFTDSKNQDRVYSNKMQLNEVMHGLTNCFQDYSDNGKDWDKVDEHNALVKESCLRLNKILDEARNKNKYSNSTASPIIDPEGGFIL